jgi:hypothetical protein
VNDHRKEAIAEFPFHHAERRGRRARLHSQIGMGIPRAGSASEVAAAHRKRDCIARGLVSSKRDKLVQAYRTIVRRARDRKDQTTDGRAWGLASEHRQVASERERWRGRSCRLRRSAGTAGRHSLLYARGRNIGKKVCEYIERSRRKFPAAPRKIEL